MAVGLRGYFHPAAGRQLDWDIRVRREPGPAADPLGQRLAAARARVGPALAATYALPSGVQHADVTLTNVLCDAEDQVTGVVDLGDMHHTAAVCDLAAALTSVLRNTGPTQPTRWSWPPRSWTGTSGCVHCCRPRRRCSVTWYSPGW